MKKKLVIISAILCLAISVAACGNNSNSPTSSESSETPAKTSSQATSSAATSSSSEVTSSKTSQEENQYITPDENLPVGDIPQPDSPPEISYEHSANQEYESGKITLSLDGDSRVVVISADSTKETILGYIDGMQASSYNAENAPPGAGYTLIYVTVHRNDVVEQYLFTNMTADGNSLGKNLQGDVFYWTIVDSNALPYFLDLLK